jgi:hypothetical protein
VASRHLLRTRGIAPWASWATSGPYDTQPVVDTSQPIAPPSQPIFDISGEGAATPTATIMDQIQAQAASVGIDLTSPVTDIMVAAGVAAAAYLLGRAL